MIEIPIRDDFESEKEYFEALNECLEDIRVHNLHNHDIIIETSKEERLLEFKKSLGIE